MRLKKGAIARHCNSLDFATCFGNSPDLYGDVEEWIAASNIFDTISEVYSLERRNTIYDIIFED